MSVKLPISSFIKLNDELAELGLCPKRINECTSVLVGNVFAGYWVGKEATLLISTEDEDSIKRILYRVNEMMSVNPALAFTMFKQTLTKARNSLMTYGVTKGSGYVINPESEDEKIELESLPTYKPLYDEMLAVVRKIASN